MRTRRRGFTLVELLIVISIIALLAGLTASVVVSAAKRRHTVRVMSRLNQIKLAIEQFKLENNQYPWDLPPNDTTDVVPVFTDVAKELNPSNTDLAGNVVYNVTKRDYLQFASSGSKKEIDGTGKVVDPWGVEYNVYWNLSLDKVVLWSNGPNGADETSDDAAAGTATDFGDDITTMK
ncbi:MAG: prepilin-type N-terminal cleavage/methylation domain-containing protein [Planctomycetes bacterium]|nr:prepilin-type N-terminal cleavage/methylation domain-containing protein [Planctomycetota bacterium]